MENRKKIMDLVIFAGVALFASSFFVLDDQTAVNRRYGGLIIAGVGLALK